MKRKTLVFILIFLFLVALFLGVACWQWNNITAFRYAVTYTPEEQQELAKEAEQVLQRISDEYADVDFSKLPEEGIEMLAKGELSEEVAVAVMTGKLTWEEAKEQPLTVPATDEASNVEASKVESILARIYALRSSYTGRIDALVGQAISDYTAKKGTKSQLMAKYIGLGHGLEGECDAQMEALLSELSKELKRTGGDLSLISEIRSAYQTEKSLKKAEIIGKYQK